jgi:peptide/nickel transport system ATP-binding protein
MVANTVLSVRNLSVDYLTERGSVQGVRDVSFDLGQGEALALIGESGCGKTTLGLSLLRLLPQNSRVTDASQVIYSGLQGVQSVDVLKLDNQQLRRFRWKACAMVFQAALNAFNPVLRISDHVYDTARAHDMTDRQAVRERILHLFRLVRLEPKRVFNAYPHELSGGMRQRVLIALSLLLDPSILILDEPTTALDILTQRTIIDVLRNLREKLSFSMIFISHDLSIAAELADRVATMYAGKIVEAGSVSETFYRPHHPYTYGLIHAVPLMSGGHRDLISIPGSPPDMIDLPSGCKFHPRCSYATEICIGDEPTLQKHADGETDIDTNNHWAACYNTDILLADQDASVPLAQEIQG